MGGNRLPFTDVHPGVAFRVRQEIKSRIIATESEAGLRSSLAFRKSVVAVGFASVYTLCWCSLYPDRIAFSSDLPVCGFNQKSVHARFIKVNVFSDVLEASPAEVGAYRVSPNGNMVRGHLAAGPVVAEVFTANGNRKLLCCLDNRRRKATHRMHRSASAPVRMHRKRMKISLAAHTGPFRSKYTGSGNASLL